jgi:hypothetical protein
MSVAQLAKLWEVDELAVECSWRVRDGERSVIDTSCIPLRQLRCTRNHGRYHERRSDAHTDGTKAHIVVDLPVFDHYWATLEIVELDTGITSPHRAEEANLLVVNEDEITLVKVLPLC